MGLSPSLWLTASISDRSCVEISRNGWNNSDSLKQRGLRPDLRLRRVTGDHPAFEKIITADRHAATMRVEGKFIPIKSPPESRRGKISVTFTVKWKKPSIVLNPMYVCANVWIHIWLCLSATLCTCPCVSLHYTPAMFVLVHGLLCLHSWWCVCCPLGVCVHGCDWSPVVAQITLSLWSQSPVVLFSVEDERLGLPSMRTCWKEKEQVVLSL